MQDSGAMLCVTHAREQPPLTSPLILREQKDVAALMLGCVIPTYAYKLSEWHKEMWSLLSHSKNPRCFSRAPLFCCDLDWFCSQKYRLLVRV